MTAFRPLQGVHEHVYSANISELNPLHKGHVIVALRPVTAKSKAPPQIVIGQGMSFIFIYGIVTCLSSVSVVAMYSQSYYRGAQHEAVTELKSSGLPSYVYIQVYAPFSGAIMSSLSCPSLATTTFLQIPRTHILFSLASYGMSWTEVTSADAHLFTMLTLGPETFAIFSTFLRHAHDFKTAVQVLKGLLSSRGSMATKLAAGAESSSEGSDLDSSDSNE